MNASVWILIAAGAAMFLVIGGLSMMSHHYTLGNIKSRTVGDGQHGTARWATDKEIKQTYAHVPFKVREWRRGQNLPTEQGLILGCKGQPQELTALVDSDDIHCLMIGASGIGKTAFFLYPNLEYACASGMSWLALDSKGDLARNYGTIAKNCYGYNVSVIDLRNPTRSDGNNLLTLVNRYMDIARKDPKNLAARAKAEKYAKILAKTIVNPDGDDSNRGQNPQIPLRCITVQVDQEFIDQYLQEISGDLEVNFSDFFKEKGKFYLPNVNHAMQSLYEYLLSMKASRITVEAKIYEIISYLASYLKENRLNEENGQPINKTDLQALDELTHYMDEHYSFNITLQTLSTIACMSESKMKKLFKSVYNMSITEYIQRKRISVAEHMLIQTDLTIAEISRIVGYSNPSRLIEIFKRYYGFTPSKYRK